MVTKGNVPDQTPLGGYKSDHVVLNFNSNLTPPEAEALVGRMIVKVIGLEYLLRLVLDDGSALEVAGHQWEEGALGVIVDDSEVKS